MFNSLKTAEPLKLDRLLLTTKFARVPSTHLIDLERMTSRINFGVNHWFWARFPKLGIQCPNNLKLAAAIFYQIFIFNQMIALQKLWKMFFLFHLKSYFRSRDIQFFVFPSSPLFLPVSHCVRVCLKINLKVYDIIDCLNKNLITHFVWNLGKEKGMTLKLCPLIEY